MTFYGYVQYFSLKTTIATYWFQIQTPKSDFIETNEPMKTCGFRCSLWIEKEVDRLFLYWWFLFLLIIRIIQWCYNTVWVLASDWMRFFDNFYAGSFTVETSVRCAHRKKNPLCMPRFKRTLARLWVARLSH